MPSPNLLKWLQTIKTAWSNYLTYRFNFFLLIIGPALVFFFIKYNLWSSIYDGDDELVLQGYSFEEMIAYHGLSLIVSLLAQGHNSNNLSEDIRMGRISTYLIYPFNFWEYHTASFLAFQGIQILVASFTLSFLIFIGVVPFLSFQVILIGFLTCLWISCFWYILQFLTGVLGFWLEETWILRVTLQILTVFLSGAIIPLEMYPKAFVDFLNYTPFPYLTYYPIKIFSGEIEHIATALSMIGFWSVVFIIINVLIWRKGLKLYTAAGI